MLRSCKVITTVKNKSKEVIVMINKLNEILSIYEEKHLDFFFLHSKEELNNYKELLLDKVGLNTKEDLFYIVKLILKYMLGGLDTHTDIRYGRGRSSGLEFRIINGNLYTIRTSEEFSDYNYMKLVGINGVDIKTIIEEISKITNYSVQEELNNTIEYYINCLLLDRIPMFRNCDILRFNFTDGINLDYDINSEYSVRHKIGDNCSYKIINNAIIFQYIACMEPREGYLKETVEKMKKEIQANGIENFVIDLRYNRGGNSAIINPLLEYLKESNLNIITFTNKYIYSSGALAVNDFKNIGSISIGTGIGTKFNHFGDITFTEGKIDDTEYRMPISFQYFYLGDNGEIEGVSTKDELHKLSKDKFEQKEFEPDIFVNETIEDMKEDRDVYLEALYEYLNKEKSHKV